MGGFDTKIHLKTDHQGQPIAFRLTGGEKNGAPVFYISLDLGPDLTPRAIVADKDYDKSQSRGRLKAWRITGDSLSGMQQEDPQNIR
ncbi:MAG: hypothetical protein ACR2Q4_24740 [Geminicoccaceae bacterium]